MKAEKSRSLSQNQKSSQKKGGISTSKTSIYYSEVFSVNRGRMLACSKGGWGFVNFYLYRY